MPFKRVGKKVINKKTGRNMGVSDTVQKAKAHMRALYANTIKEGAKQPKKITQRDTLKSIRKPMPPPQKPFDSSNNKKYNRQKFKDYFKGY